MSPSQGLSNEHSLLKGLYVDEVATDARGKEVVARAGADSGMYMVVKELRLELSTGAT
jgi:hypothetical protein